jgi:2-amino-4-hydroxy-6-hydroxymethyldihydropteridine diphosphokinase
MESSARPEVVVYIALGSNMGDRKAHLRQAIEHLSGCLTVDHLSSVVETAPAYVTEQAQYFNMVLAGRTRLDPHGLLDCLKALERQLGRVTGLRFGPRPIDLDILVYGDLRLDDPDLQIPHPRLHERAFVLEPLAEVAPDFVPPGLTMTVRELAHSGPLYGDIIARLGPLSDL